MIDRRNPVSHHPEPARVLDGISDSEVLLNFQSALTALYPRLVTVRLHSGQGFLDLSERLYFDLVYGRFAQKFGLTAPYKEYHRYCARLHCYRKINHVECVPKRWPLPIFRGGMSTKLSHEELQDKVIVFRRFADLSHDLTTSLDLFEASRVNFDLVSVELVDATTGYRFREFFEHDIFVRKEDLEFEFVVESFDVEEHRGFRDILL